MLGQVRRFNRTITQRVGALDDRYLARSRPLGEARVLWEIGTEGCEVRAVRSRLGLDSGHASRLLRALEADGLVRVEPSPSDRRIRIARLTPAGVSERALLDERSDDLAASILAPLDTGQRDEIVAAMRTVQRLLMAAAVEIRRVDPTDPDARRCIRAYFAELDRRSNSGFDPGASISVEPHEVVPPAGCFLIAYLRGEPVGCGAVRHRPGAVSELKRMWVAESARGLGIGRRLLTELEARAARGGAAKVRLDTNRALVEAIAMYRSAGYAEVPAFNDEPFAHHWFEKQLG
jgi:DNA-binding MarR family transcriptional regulator